MFSLFWQDDFALLEKRKFVLAYLDEPPYNKRAAKRPRRKHGCLAQLGEHLFDVQEVTGSIPVAPTTRESSHGPARGFLSFIEYHLSH